MLEEGFDRLYWPRTMKGARIISAHPGYIYEFFETYAELNEYFTEICGADWRTQEWAKFWYDQHTESVNSDTRERNFNILKTYRKKTDADAVYECAKNILINAPRLSTRKLTYTLNRQGINISVRSAWKIIQQFKKELESGS